LNETARIQKLEAQIKSYQRKVKLNAKSAEKKAAIN
jgi:hypothetical protein